MKTVILPPAFLPPASYYAAMAQADCVVIDTAMAYAKRDKAVHRTVIAGAHGPLNLTVPVSAHAARTWDDVTVSAHGEWWRTMRSTLSTLFDPTPFFRYYAPMLMDGIIDHNAPGQAVTRVDIDLDMAVRRLLGLQPRMSVTVDSNTSGANIIDLRGHDFYADPLPDELAPGRSVIEPLFTLGGAEVMRLIKTL